MAPRFCRQRIWKLRRTARHILLVVAAEIRNVLSISGDVVVHTEHVRAQIGRNGSIELEPTGIQAIAKPEIVGWISGCGLGQDIPRNGVDINQCSACRRVGIVVKPSRQPVKISLCKCNYGGGAVRFVRNELQQTLSETCQRNGSINRNLPGVTTSFVVVKEEKAILRNRTTK